MQLSIIFGEEYIPIQRSIDFASLNAGESD